MEVILLETVDKLGKIGEVVNVKNGYGRNFLIPQGKALRATNDNKAEFEKQKAAIQKANEEKIEAAKKSSSKVEGKFFVVIRQAGEDGRLYGSVNARDIADEVSKGELEVKKNQIILHTAIKYLGVQKIKIKLHPDVAVEAFVVIGRSEDEAAEAKKEFLSPTAKQEEAEEAPAKKSKAIAGENAEEIAEAEENAETAEKPKAAKKAKAKKEADEE